MRCPECGSTMTVRRENYRYSASGLPYVTLQNVEVRRCECGEMEVAIPAIEELHRTIARALIRKRAPLAAEEIRFLRKSLGWSGVDFARHMGTTPETVTRWEKNGKMNDQAERLLRLLVANKEPVDHYPVDVLAQISADLDPRPMRLPLERHGEHGWQYPDSQDLVSAETEE